MRGARQVGKTTLVRMLAEHEGLHLIEVNMETRPVFVSLLGDKSQAKLILESLIVEFGLKVPPDRVLIFFDEAQETPGLFAYLRYFKEMAPEYRVVAAGSLFEFELNNSQVSQGPTGRVEYAYVEPMTFTEFLLARNSVAYERYQALDTACPVSELDHAMFSRYFKEYLVCGGMPKAVRSWSEEQSPLSIDEIKSDIIEGYLNDLPKYTDLNQKKYEPQLLRRLYSSVTSRPANSMKYSELAPGVRAEKVRAHLDILAVAKVIRMSLHSSENKVPLLLGENPKAYKLFSLDVGLTYTLMGLPIADVYAAPEINSVANGVIAEQYVAQTLMALPPYHKSSSLHHWERSKKNATAEVDFLFTLNGKVIPVECKAGASTKIRSLRQLLSAKAFETALRLYSGNVEHEVLSHDIQGREQKTQLISLPHYLLERFVEQSSKELVAG